MTDIQLRPEEEAGVTTYDAARASGYSPRAALKRMLTVHPTLDVGRGGRRDFMGWLGEREGM